jgi:hypothetical protein
MHPKPTAQIEATCPRCGAAFLAYRRSNGREPRYCSSVCYHAAQKGTQPAGGFASRPIEERFWEKVDRSGGPDACWLWTGGRDKDGYGRFPVSHDREMRAHRFAWESINGPMPAGLDGCHACDNPPCCNPAHVFPGTSADNQADMTAKGRGRTGERNGMVRHPERCHTARLTWEQVREIRAIFAQPNPPSHQSVADAYGIPRPTLRAIIYRQTWRDND